MKHFTETEPAQPSQKSWKFVQELAEPYHRKSTASVPAGAIRLDRGIRLETEFPDPDRRLDTAYADFETFRRDNALPEGPWTVSVKQKPTSVGEEYFLTVSESGAVLEAGDTEGIRRGIFFLEDRILEAGGTAVLPGKYHRKPWLKTRLSRCFFGPIKRPPFNRDELLDDVDYYPESYLNRLAHEGINALWLTIAFHDLCTTSMVTPSPDAGKRMAKLRRTADKCLRYGIKTYAFCIEPMMEKDSESELFRKFPEAKGAPVYYMSGCSCICMSTEAGQRYVYESVKSLFSAVPMLGGIVGISYGERTTSCLTSGMFGQNCPHCAGKTPGDLLAAVLSPMERAMHEISPEAELISWLYVPMNGTGGKPQTESYIDMAAKCPKNAVLQFNYESGGGKDQLGKFRHAGDYWLSYEGPSKLYEQIAKAQTGHGGEMSAKIQVGCSHEVATVPFVPAPGLLYRKYRTMKKLGVSHVFQCWYFGNYPGIMNRAAGELAFEEFQDDEHAFLLRLAKPDWGDSAEKVVKAWQLLTDGYANYPLDNMIQYYGPMHDGLVWPLYLIPRNTRLAPTWRLDFGTSGDRYGECLGTFTLEEVSTLFERMRGLWGKGTELLVSLKQTLRDSPERQKDIGVTEALDLQIQSTCAIFRFYALREKLLNGDSGVLAEMETIVREEKLRSERLAEFCRNDSRLGFHSEAEGYKYFPEKLLWRARELESVLKEEFPEVRKRLAAKRPVWKEPVRKTYVCGSGKKEVCGAFSWSAECSDGKLRIHWTGPADQPCTVYLETRRFHAQEEHDFPAGQTDLELSVPQGLPGVRFNIVWKESNIGWAGWNPLSSRLNLHEFNPDDMGRLTF